MSHYLPSDEAYLRALALSGPRYVPAGPLAPPRALLAALGADAAGLAGAAWTGPVSTSAHARPQAIAI